MELEEEIWWKEVRGIERSQSYQDIWVRNEPRWPSNIYIELVFLIDQEDYRHRILYPLQLGPPFSNDAKF